MSRTQTAPVRIQWASAADVGPIQQLERETFGATLGTPENFLMFLDIPNHFALVAWSGHRPLGLLACKASAARRASRLLNLFVHPRARRRGIGTALTERWLHLTTDTAGPFHQGCSVNEDNLGLCLFLRSQGATCTKVVRGGSRDGSRDVLKFHFGVA